MIATWYLIKLKACYVNDLISIGTLNPSNDCRNLGLSEPQLASCSMIEVKYEGTY